MPSLIMSPHEGGGAWPGGVGGIPPGLFGAGSLFGDGTYSGNIVQGGVTLQPQANYVAVSATDIMPAFTAQSTSGWTIDSSSDWQAAYPGWRVADNVVSSPNCWIANANTGWLKFTAPTPQAVAGYTIVNEPSEPARAPKNWTFEGSNTGSFSGEQTVMDTRVGETGWNGTIRTYTCSAPGTFQYFRLNITLNNGDALIRLLEVQLYGGCVVTNAIVITGAATVAPDSTTGASVVSCDTLVIDGASASLKPSTNSKGLIIYAKTGITLLNGAKLNIDKLGKAGNFGNLTAYDLAPLSIRRKLKKSALGAYVVQGEGAAGAAAVTGVSVTGLTGAAAAAMQAGGGGSGCTNGGSGATVSGAGGKGGSCCGGAGGGACVSNGLTAPAAGAYGGPGGDGVESGYAAHGAGGGAGDPVGAPANSGGTGLGAGGGLLMLFSPSVAIASGCVVSSDGAGTELGTNTYKNTGAGAGGGCVCIVTETGGYSNAGTVRAAGGVAPTGNMTGGFGGAGSVNTFTV